MKKLALVLMVVVCSFAAKAQKYNLSKESEMVLGTAIFPGYNPAYVVDKSKEKSIKKTPKESYTTVAKGPDGKPVTIAATPRIGEKVLEFEGQYWYNITTGQMLMKQQASAPETHVVKNNKQSQGQQQDGVQKSKGPGLGQILQTGAMIFQGVRGRIPGGPVGVGQDSGLGNGPIQSGQGMRF